MDDPARLKLIILTRNPPDAFPSSAAFDLINETLAANPKEREAAIKAAQGIFAFTLTNEAGATESWYLDFKKDGVACKSAAPDGGKADGKLKFCAYTPESEVPQVLTSLQSPSSCPSRTLPASSLAPPTPSVSSWAASSRSAATP